MNLQEFFHHFIFLQQNFISTLILPTCLPVSVRDMTLTLSLRPTTLLILWNYFCLLLKYNWPFLSYNIIFYHIIPIIKWNGLEFSILKKKENTKIILSYFTSQSFKTQDLCQQDFPTSCLQFLPVSTCKLSNDLLFELE